MDWIVSVEIGNSFPDIVVNNLMKFVINVMHT